ncbi:MAG: hypothetical protein RLZZ357_647 [Bacteroidota bacterium]|jgi:hypothetical protein
MNKLENSQTLQMTTKKQYIAPKVEKVQLDAEISMVMMSTPPIEGIPTHDPLIQVRRFRLFH